MLLIIYIQLNTPLQAAGEECSPNSALPTMSAPSTTVGSPQMAPGHCWGVATTGASSSHSYLRQSILNSSLGALTDTLDT